MEFNETLCLSHRDHGFTSVLLRVCVCVCIKTYVITTCPCFSPFRFELLEILSFDSVRRRMSVIVKSAKGT